MAAKRKSKKRKTRRYDKSESESSYGLTRGVTHEGATINYFLQPPGSGGGKKASRDWVGIFLRMFEMLFVLSPVLILLYALYTTYGFFSWLFSWIPFLNTTRKTHKTTKTGGGGAGPEQDYEEDEGWTGISWVEIVVTIAVVLLLIYAFFAIMFPATLVKMWRDYVPSVFDIIPTMYRFVTGSRRRDKEVVKMGIDEVTDAGNETVRQIEYGVQQLSRIEKSRDEALKEANELRGKIEGLEQDLEELSYNQNNILVEERKIQEGVQANLNSEIGRLQDEKNALELKLVRTEETANELNNKFQEASREINGLREYLGNLSAHGQSLILAKDATIKRLEAELEEERRVLGRGKRSAEKSVSALELEDRSIIIKKAQKTKEDLGNLEIALRFWEPQLKQEQKI